MQVRKYKNKETGNEVTAYYIGNETPDAANSKLSNFGISISKVFKNRFMDGESWVLNEDCGISFIIESVLRDNKNYEFIGDFEPKWVDKEYTLVPLTPEQIGDEEIEKYDDIYTEMPHVFIEDIIRYAIDKGRSVTYKDLYIH